MQECTFLNQVIHLPVVGSIYFSLSKLAPNLPLKPKLTLIELIVAPIMTLLIKQLVESFMYDYLICTNLVGKMTIFSTGIATFSVIAIKNFPQVNFLSKEVFEIAKMNSYVLGVYSLDKVLKKNKIIN
jgi:hypothetical protein